MACGWGDRSGLPGLSPAGLPGELLTPGAGRRCPAGGALRPRGRGARGDGAAGGDGLVQPVVAQRRLCPLALLRALETGGGGLREPRPGDSAITVCGRGEVVGPPLRRPPRGARAHHLQRTTPPPATAAGDHLHEDGAEASFVVFVVLPPGRVPAVFTAAAGRESGQSRRRPPGSRRGRRGRRRRSRGDRRGR